MKYSMYHTFKIEDMFFFYDGNTARFYKLLKSEYEKLICSIEKEDSELIGFLYTKDEIKSLELEKKRHIGENFQRSGVINVVNVNMTSECNLRCRYCWNHYGSYQGKYKKVKISKCILDKIMNYIESQFGENIQLGFYGGEPLLDLEIAEYAINLFSSSEKIKYIHITTNGTTINNKFCDKIKGNRKLLFTVSLDGSKEYHNKNRIFRNGKGSFDACIRGINILRKNNFEVSIKSTLDIDDYNFFKQAEYFLDNNFLNFNITLNALNRNFDEKKYREEYIKYIKYAFSLYKRNSTILQDFKQLVDTTIALKPQTYCCSAGNRRIGVDMNGDIYPCEIMIGLNEMYLGNIIDPEKNKIIQDNFLSNYNLKVREIEECSNCWLVNKCFLGCVADNFIKNKTLFIPDYINCRKSKNSD
ncbi:MAG: radical SAM protein [Candidatus Cloacimonetes bacterium]|nr:radical SAM protein [Candidatus Cloacimonadota bacterium]